MKFPEGHFIVESVHGSHWAVSRADTVMDDELALLGLTTRDLPNLVCINTHVFRPPQKGEWFISGVPFQARKAKEDMSDSFCIGMLAVVEQVYKVKKVP